ncbi:hypothetical protein [Streptomyces afghaniensis]|uniref:hypothetical protein n=1 Tax=Streptomyces afghaniensis TaxID=66865 RepID=UPI003799694E
MRIEAGCVYAVADERGVGGDDDIEGQREFEAPGDGVTVQDSDHGLGLAAIRLWKSPLAQKLGPLLATAMTAVSGSASALVILAACVWPVALCSWG